MDAKLGWGVDENKEQDIFMSKCLPHRVGISHKGEKLEDINRPITNGGRLITGASGRNILRRYTRPVGGGGCGI